MARYYDVIGQKTELLTEVLTENFSNYGYEVREEYAELTAEYPITVPVMTVGLYNLVMCDFDCGNYLGSDMETGLSRFGRVADVTYRVTIHSSAQYAYNVCRSAAAIIAEACIGVFDVQKVKSGSSKYDRQCRCVTMPVDVTVRYLLT